jgi:hypothetical protein
VLHQLAYSSDTTKADAFLTELVDVLRRRGGVADFTLCVPACGGEHAGRKPHEVAAACGRLSAPLVARLRAAAEQQTAAAAASAALPRKRGPPPPAAPPPPQKKTKLHASAAPPHAAAHAAAAPVPLCVAQTPLSLTHAAGGAGGAVAKKSTAKAKASTSGAAASGGSLYFQPHPAASSNNPVFLQSGMFCKSPSKLRKLYTNSGWVYVTFGIAKDDVKEHLQSEFSKCAYVVDTSAAHVICDPNGNALTYERELKR